MYFLLPSTHSHITPSSLHESRSDPSSEQYQSTNFNTLSLTFDFAFTVKPAILNANVPGSYTTPSLLPTSRGIKANLKSGSVSWPTALKVSILVYQSSITKIFRRLQVHE